jgi:hypothetical protein
MNHSTSSPTPVKASCDDEAAVAETLEVPALPAVGGVAVVGVVSGAVVLVVELRATGLVVVVVDVVVVDVVVVVVVVVEVEDVGVVDVVVVVGLVSGVAVQHAPASGDTAAASPTIQTASTAIDDGLPMQDAGKLSRYVFAEPL